ncbi:eukaryotic translation initiation factor 3 subunit A-like, partial [Dendropsophus ebraccatus]|uniref:eukaryotic translation initiation factor 3 subunit A-like n=1 Tax=Dendropsophus ebraccatus TaxID=150705 RepID=UPI0038321589
SRYPSYQGDTSPSLGYLGVAKCLKLSGVTPAKSNNKLVIGIFSRDAEVQYSWLMTLLGLEVFRDYVQSVRPCYISNTGFLQFYEDVNRCTFGILYHSKNRGRINVTNIEGSLYDEELEHLSSRLGKEKVIVVIDDLEDSSDDHKTRILEHQPSIMEKAEDLFLISPKEKSRPMVDRGELEKKLQMLRDIIREKTAGARKAEKSEAAAPKEAGGNKDPAAPIEAGGNKDPAAPKEAGGNKDPAAPKEAGGNKAPAAPKEAGGNKDPAAPIEAGGNKDTAAPKEDGGDKDPAAPIEAGGNKDPAAPKEAGGDKDPAAPKEAGGDKEAAAPKEAGGNKDPAAPKEAGGNKDTAAPKEDGGDKDPAAPIEAGGNKDPAAPIEARGDKEAAAPKEAAAHVSQAGGGDGRSRGASEEQEKTGTTQGMIGRVWETFNSNIQGEISSYTCN